MAGGKGKSTGGKAGPKDVQVKAQKSHSAKAGLQVRVPYLFLCASIVVADGRRALSSEVFKREKALLAGGVKLEHATNV